MASVVCEPCIKCKYTDCVEVCPVGCFHEGENMLVIDPMNALTAGCVSMSVLRAPSVLRRRCRRPGRNSSN